MAASTLRIRCMTASASLALACSSEHDATDIARGAGDERDASNIVAEDGAMDDGAADAAESLANEDVAMTPGASDAESMSGASASGTLISPIVVPEPIEGSTLQDFSAPPALGCPGDTGAGTPFACHHDALDPQLASPVVLTGAGDDPARFLRLAAVPALGHDHNTITFPQTAAGVRDSLLADFDFRITPVEGRGRGDGFGFAFLNAAAYPDGAGPPSAVLPPPIAEEPSFIGSLGVGFDIFKGAAEGDIGNENILPAFSNSVSIHYDGQVLAQLDVEKVSDLASGLWHHARILMRQTASGGRLSVWLTPPCGKPFAIVEERAIFDAAPYEARAWFGARSGGEAASHDIANVRVHYMPAAASWVSFVSRAAEADEGDGSVALTLHRDGDLSAEVSVEYATRDGSALAALDYAASAGSVTFAAGQAEQTILIPLLDDALDETRSSPAIGRAEIVPDVGEAFEVVLTGASAGAAVAGPAVARVSLFDDEGARVHGHWGLPLCWHIIGMHTHVLPQTGDVLYWDRLGNVGEWSPNGNVARLLDGPGHNLFCAGHAFLPDGALLIAGGHDDPQGAAMGHDGVGIDNLALFVPTHVAEEHPWHPLAAMNAPRWYPTITTLSDGTALLISGSLDVDYTKNLLPQIYDPGSDTLRDLTAAVDPVPHGVQLYPWMFALPDAQVAKVGPDADAWRLDTAGAGAWAPGPLRADGLVLDYGSAALRGREALVFGGGGAEPDGAAPSNVVAGLDLETPEAWVERPGMLIPRRQHNATLLPDGRVLVTGGSSAPGFSNRDGAATPAEVFDGEGWRMLPAAAVQRLYHSSAVLLPDGRVVAAGGGQGAGATSFQSSAEIYYPDYWFKPRPTLVTAPAEVVYDVPFALVSSATIERVTALRMPSVTHSFDQNQRFAELGFTRTPQGVSAVVPSNGWVPPGHYILYVLDAAGVPSLGSIVHLSDGL